MAVAQPVPIGTDLFNGEITGDVAATMGTRGSSVNASGPTVLHPTPFDATQITSAANYSRPQPGDPCHPLAAGAHAPAIAIQGAATRENPASGPGGVGVRIDDTAYTLEARSEVQAVACVSAASLPVPFQETADCLTSAYGTKWNGNASADNGSLYAQHAMQVRRLTPRECERLQGFPDDWTLIQYRGKPAADGPRYKALGNSMAVPVMAWIGRRIQMVEDLAPESALPAIATK